jgi:hypothetical protein
MMMRLNIQATTKDSAMAREAWIKRFSPNMLKRGDINDCRSANISGISKLMLEAV